MVNQLRKSSSQIRTKYSTLHHFHCTSESVLSMRMLKPLLQQFYALSSWVAKQIKLFFSQLKTMELFIKILKTHVCSSLIRVESTIAFPLGASPPLNCNLVSQLQVRTHSIDQNIESWCYIFLISFNQTQHSINKWLFLLTCTYGPKPVCELEH